VHRGLGEEPGGTRPEALRDILGHGDLSRRAEHQRATRAQQLDFALQVAQAAGAEDHTRRRACVRELVHRHASPRVYCCHSSRPACWAACFALSRKFALLFDSLAIQPYSFPHNY
jgi:hypothetical protein